MNINSNRLGLAALFLILGSASHSHAELPPIESAGFDPQRGFLVNAKPFFPIVLYDAPTDDETLAKLHEHGFNVVTAKPDICDGLPSKGFYGAIHVGKSVPSLKGVFLAIGSDSPALYYKKDLLAQTAEANAKVATAAPGRPLMNAIGYWEDEPEGVYSGKLPSRAKYEDLVAAIDVAAPYLYPVPYQPVASVGEAVARARAATGGKKPLLPVLQLFAWKPTDRYPTPAELRAMVFLSLVEGAHGIGYYSFGHVTGKPKTTIAEAQPELWQSVQTINREVFEIGPRLVRGSASREFALEKENSAIKSKVIRDEKGVLAVLVNGSPDKQRAMLVWNAAGATGSITVNSEPLPLDKGSADVSFEPFGVRIIRWVDSPKR